MAGTTLIPSAPRRLERCIAIAVVALSLVPIWGVYYPPLLDFPEHVLLTGVLAAGNYDAGPDYSGHLELRSLWRPYGFFYALSAPLARLVGPNWSVRVWLSLAVIGSALALRWLLARFGRSPTAFYFAYPFLFSTNFLSGVIPFFFGTPAMLVLAGWVVLRPATRRTTFVPRLGLMFLLAWIHPVLYAGEAAFLAPLVLAFNRGRERLRQWLVSLLWIAAPGLYLVVLSPPLHHAVELSWAGKFQRLREFAANLSAGQPEWLIRLPLVIWFLWIAFDYAFIRGRLNPEEQQTRASVDDEGSRRVVATVWLLIVVLALPEAAAGLFVATSFRLIPLALLMAACLIPNRYLGEPLLAPSEPRQERVRWIAPALLVAWCMAVLVGKVAFAREFDRQMQDFARIERAMQPRQTTVLLFEGNENLLFNRALAYYHLAKGGISPGMFMLLPDKHIPAALPPPYPWRPGDWQAPGAAPLFDPQSRAFRYVVVKTSRAPDAPLPDGPPPYHVLTARSGGWLLFERR